MKWHHHARQTIQAQKTLQHHGTLLFFRSGMVRFLGQQIITSQFQAFEERKLGFFAKEVDED